MTRCPHDPPCPAADATDREAAHTIAAHPEQGWSLLCNGVVLFDDTGEILPDTCVIAPHRPTGHLPPIAAALTWQATQATRERRLSPDLVPGAHDGLRNHRGDSHLGVA
jgi:hypothetical protein